MMPTVAMTRPGTSFGASVYHVDYAKRAVADDYYVDHIATIYVMHPDGTYSSRVLSTANSTDITRTMRQRMDRCG